MIGQKFRGTAIALMLLSTSATQAQACSWFHRWCGRPAATTTFYAPVAAAPACGPAPCAQVVNYMPQTCYRTVVVNTPVVAYRPVTACDPCTGCPTTVMRPVTSCVAQQQLVPYTTFRPVVTAMPVAPACNTCAPAATTTFFAPAVTTVPAAAPAAAPSCCTPSLGAAPVQTTTSYAQAPPVSAPAPLAVTTPAPQPMPMAAGTPGSTIQSLAPAPAPAYPVAPQTPGVQGQNVAQPYPSPVTGGTASPSDYPRTFQENGTNENHNGATNGATNGTNTNGSNNGGATSNPGTPETPPQSRLLLPPRENASGAATSNRIRGLDPEVQDRTTALPIRQAWAVRQASAVTPINPPAAKAQLEDDGWRAARSK